MLHFKYVTGLHANCRGQRGISHSKLSPPNSALYSASLVISILNLSRLSLSCLILQCQFRPATSRCSRVSIPFYRLPPHPKCSLSILKRGIEKIRPFKTSKDQRKGRYLYDVHRFFGFFYLLPLPCLHSANYLPCKSTQPPLHHLYFHYPSLSADVI